MRRRACLRERRTHSHALRRETPCRRGKHCRRFCRGRRQSLPQMQIVPRRVTATGLLFRTTSATCPTAFFTEADAVLAAEIIDERIICAVILLSLRCGFTSGFTFSFPLLRLGTTFHHSLRSFYQPQGVKYVGKVCIFALFYKKVTVMKKNRCIII